MLRSWILLAVLPACLCSRRIVDLTHTFDVDAAKYPLTSFNITDLTYYKMKTLSAQYYPNGMWVAFRHVEFYEHLGTHMDAPNHFGKGRQAMHEVPPSRLMGPGVVIDVRRQSEQNANYAVTVEDLKNWEKIFGPIPPNAIVIMNSGWGAKYPNAELVFGSETLEDQQTFNFPGFSPEACDMLLNERQVGVVGVDTPSTDPGQPAIYPCHMLLQPNQVPLLEYVANLDAIPQSGTTIFLGAIKTRNGTGGPTRILAVVDDSDTTDGGHDNGVSLLVLSLSLVSVIVWNTLH